MKTGSREWYDQRRKDTADSLVVGLSGCPFCGSVPLGRVGQLNEGGDCCDVFVIECTNCEQHPIISTCGPWGYPRKGDMTRDGAIEKVRRLWNTRSRCED